MPHCFKCDSCKFEFHSGHSHDAGYSEAICKNCLSRFVLPTQTPWGATVGEIIELRILPKSKKLRAGRSFDPKRDSAPTGQELLVEELPNAKFRGMVHYPIENVNCISCNSEGSVVMGFTPNESCPKCKTGSIEAHEIEY